MKQVVQVLVLMGWMLLARQVWAQDPAKAAPEAKKLDITAEQVLDKYVEATGGRQAYQKITSMVAKATLEMTAQGIQGRMEFYAKAPNKRLEVGNIEGIGEIREGYDGKVGWSQDPFQGLREMEGVELAILKRKDTFYAELKWRELFKKVELVGREKVGDREAYVIRLTPGVGSPITRYYDTQTFLLLREDSVQEGPQGTIPIQEYYSDYREVDGVKFPFQMIQKSPMGDAVTKINQIKTNVEIDDAMFAKPQASEKQ